MLSLQQAIKKTNKMLSVSTLFVVLYFFWGLILLLGGDISIPVMAIGGCVCLYIAYLSWKLKVTVESDQFMFLQAGFYKFIFKMINNRFGSAFRLASEFLNPKKEFQPLLDYVFLNKDSTAEVTLAVNLLMAMPGIIAVATKKRYIIVHSLGDSYFTLTDMFNISNEISKVHDDSLI